MKFKKTEFEGLFLLETDRYDDNRGYLSKLFDKESFLKNKHKFILSQVKYVHTEFKATIRGMHFQLKPYEEDKLVHCVRGEIYEVAIDIRKKSRTYGKCFEMKFSANNKTSLLIPKGFAHGYQTLSNNCEILYLMTGKFSEKGNSGFMWNDPHFNINWPLKPSIIATKDQQWSNFNK